MARRIVLTMLLLVSALLVTAVAPLGLLIAGREQDAFRMETVLSAQTLASSAERGLMDPRPGPVLAAAFVHARAASDEVWVFNADAHLAGHFGGAKRENVPVPPGAITGVLRHSGMMTVTAAGGELRVTLSVDGTTSDSPPGALVLARPTGELNDRLRMLWTWLIGVAAVGLLAAAIFAVMLARWVAGRCPTWTRRRRSSAAARWAPVPRPTTGRPRYAGSPSRSTPWPGGSRHWSTVTRP